MRILSISLCILLVTIVHGQIVLGPGDMPSAGDTLHFATTQATELDVSLTGEDMLWDFTMLTPMVEDQDIAVAVSATPFLYQFYFNNPILYPEHVASLAMAGEPFDFQLLQVEDVYEYFRKNADGYWNVGFGAMANGLPASVRRIPTDRIHAFPLAFGNADQSFSSWHIEVPGTFYFQQDQWRDNTVDGWGTLHLPGGTYDVLRVRSVLQRHDSIYVSQFGLGFGLDEPETVEYKWLAQGMGRPVLTITTIAGTPVMAEYFDDEIGTAMAHHQEAETLALYPNPADDILGLSIPEGAGGTLVIRDQLGRVTMDLGTIPGNGRVEVPVTTLANGHYTVQLRSADHYWSGRFVVAR